MKKSAFLLFFVVSLFFATKVSADTIAQDTTWTLSNSPYIVDTLYVNSGVTLTIEPGVVIKFRNISSVIFLNGTINAFGTADSNIYFTSFKDDTVGGDTNGDGAATIPAVANWDKIYVIGAGKCNFSHVVLRYAGKNSPASGLANYGGIVNIANSKFSNNNIGIYQDSGNITITASELFNQNMGFYLKYGSATIAKSHIHNNPNGGVYSVYGQPVDARNNYWGDPSGPYNKTSNPGGLGNSVTTGVLFNPWCKDQTCISGFSSVLFLPGIEGSRLYARDDNGGTTKLWEPNGNNNQIENLSLNPDGTPNSENIYTRDVIDNAYFPITGDIYKSFLDQLGLMKNTDHLINDYSVVPYDWRLSIDDLVNNGNKLADGRIYYSGSLAQTSTPYIIKELRRLAAGSNTGKVTIVAHSMGGLVTKELTDKLGPEASSLIDKIIFVAVPQVGTPKAIGGLLHGYDMALPKSYLSAFGISNSAIRDLGQNMPSAFNLLPSSSYFNSVNDSVITFDNSPMLSPWREKYGSAISSVAAMHYFLTDQAREILPTENNIYSPPVLNEFLLNKSEAFHSILDSWTPPAGVELTEIAGWGYDTMKTVEYYQGWDLHCGSLWPTSFVYCVPVQSLKYRPKTVLDGDGTVLIPSALWMPESTSVKRYFVDLRSYNKPLVGRSHANILEVPQLRTFIENVITNSADQLPQYISTTAPDNTNPETRLHFILHSPLSLDLYDDQGNHTGLSSTTNTIEENISGSNYQEFGEVKYISAPASVNLHLAMKGYDNGSFTLDVNEVRGNEVISSTTFAAVPVLTGAIATLDIPKDGGVVNISPLSVDENGDGILDITLVSKPGEVVIPDFVPPVTTASVSGVAGLKGWYVSDATISFTATDSDTGVKQTLYSLNNGATYNIYTAPLKISAEGTTSILYYSTDNQGNKEEAKILAIKIDKTAPEPKISIDPLTKDLKVEGFDNLSQTVVFSDLNVYTITDDAGNATKLFFQKIFTRKLLTLAKLTGIQYNNDPIVDIPNSSFVYLWNPLANIVLSQTIIVNKTYVIEAVYNNKKNQTTVLLKEKGSAIQKQVFTGFHASKLIINKGVIGYEL
jgi:pimeloyl-ACP methyl ester carboxylesterase